MSDDPLFRTFTDPNRRQEGPAEPSRPVEEFADPLFRTFVGDPQDPTPEEQELLQGALRVARGQGAAAPAAQPPPGAPPAFEPAPTASPPPSPAPMDPAAGFGISPERAALYQRSSALDRFAGAPSLAPVEAQPSSIRVQEERHLERAREFMGHTGMEDLPSRGPAIPPAERFSHAANRFTQGIAGVPVGLLEGIALLAHDLDRITGTGQYEGQEVMDLATWRWAQNVRAFAAGIFPESEELQESFWNDAVPAALGSFAGFIGAGFGAGAVAGRAGAVYSSVALAGASGSSQAFNEALSLEASSEDAMLAARWGVLPGVVQVFPVIRALDRATGRMPQEARSRILHSLKSGAKGALEEAVAEGLGAVGFELIARHIHGVERDMWERVWESAGPAGVAGGIVNILLGARGFSVSGTRTLPPTDPAREIIDQFDQEPAPAPPEADPVDALPPEAPPQEEAAPGEEAPPGEPLPTEAPPQEEAPAPESPPAPEDGPQAVEEALPPTDAPPSPPSIADGELAGFVEGIEAIDNRLVDAFGRSGPQVGENAIYRGHAANTRDTRQEMIEAARARLAELDQDGRERAIQEIRERSPVAANAIEGVPWMPYAVDETGFLEETFYHGATFQFDAESLRPGAQGLFITKFPGHAEAYVRGEEGRVLPIQVRMRNPYIFQSGEAQVLEPADAFAQGFDAWVHLSEDGSYVLEASLSSAEQVRVIQDPAQEGELGPEEQGPGIFDTWWRGDSPIDGEEAGPGAAAPAPQERMRPGLVPADAQPIQETGDGRLPMRTTPEGYPVSPVAAFGREHNVILADGRRVPTRYALVDISGTLISHDPVTFSVNPNFPPGIQDRRYHADRVAQEEVIARAARLDPDLILDGTNLSTNGPSVIREDGVVLSGNQRVMLIERARAMHPARFEAYLEALRDRIGEYGLDPAQALPQVEAILEGGGIPGIGRVMSEAVESTVELGELMAAFNDTATKARDAVGEAQVFARRLAEAPEALRHYQETVDAEGTVNQYLTSAAGRKFLELLVQAGVIPRTQASALVDRATGIPNKRGRLIIEDMLLSAVVKDAEIVDVAPPSWLQRIQRAVPALIEVQEVEGWDLTGVIQESLRLGTTVRATDAARTVEDITGQVSFTNQWSPEAEVFAKFLEANSPTKAAAAIREYANRAVSARDQAQSADMFGFEPPHPIQAFAELFDQTGVLGTPSGEVVALSEGTPIRSRVVGEAGGARITSSRSTRSLAVQPPGSQVSTTGRPSTETTRAMKPAPRLEGGTRIVGSIDPISGKLIVQKGRSVREILARAAEAFPLTKDALEGIVAEVPNATYNSGRVKEWGERLQKKLRTRRPEHVSDYVGHRIWVTEIQAVDQVMDALEAEGFTIIEDDAFLFSPKLGYRARHIQVLMPEGDFSFELQIIPEEIGRAQDEAHHHYEIARGDGDPTAQEVRDAVMASERIFAAAWRTFLENTGRLPEAGRARPIPPAPAGEPGDTSTGKMIVQRGNDARALVDRAQEIFPAIQAQMQEIAASVPNVEFVSARVKEYGARLLKKLESRQANQVSDYIAGRIRVLTLEASDQVVDELNRRGYRLLEDDSFFFSPKLGYRARHVQVLTPDGDMSFELQIIPREIQLVQDAAHKFYEVFRGDNDPNIEQIFEAGQKSEAMFSEAWFNFRKRVGDIPPDTDTPRFIPERRPTPPPPPLIPAIEVDGQIYTGLTHGLALVQAAEATGKSMQQIADEAWGTGRLDLFQTPEGRLIDRFRASMDYGISSSENMAEMYGIELPAEAGAEAELSAQADLLGEGDQTDLLGDQGAQEGAPRGDVLEVQDDLFGAPPTVRGDVQRDMFGADPAMQGLSAAEIQARRIVESLRPLVEADVATNADLEAYRTALALLRRDEAMTAEEMTARARRINRERQQAEVKGQQDMFFLRPQDLAAAQADLSSPAVVPIYAQPLSEFAGEDPGRARIWNQKVLEAVSEGRITPEAAVELGWENRYQGRDSRFGLPELEVLDRDTPLYHVTTGREGVLSIGLRSPAQLSMERGAGLGGNQGAAISFTPSLEAANEIRQTYLLARGILRGTAPMTELVRWAENGEGAARPFIRKWVRAWDSSWSPGDPLPGELQQIIDGALPAEAILEARWEALDMWLAARTYEGGVEGVRFWGADPTAVRNLEPSDLAVLEVRPAEGARGTRWPGPLSEVQVYSGRAVELVAVDGVSAAALGPGEGTATDPGWGEANARRGLREQVALEEAPLMRPRAADLLPDVRPMARDEAGPGARPPALSEIRADMEKVLGIPIRHGRLRKLAQAFGLYQIRPEVIRTRMENDIVTIAHEVGHHMHKLLFTREAPDFDPRNPYVGLDDAALRPWAQELGPMAIGISDGSLAEGWAEYWRRWLLNRETAEARAPNLTRYLERRLPELDPALWDAVQRWQSMYEQYADATPMSRLMARMSFGETRWDRVWARAARGVERAYQEVMDKFIPLEEMHRDVLGAPKEKRLDMLANRMDQIPKIMADLIAGSAGMADHFISRSPVDAKTGQPRSDVKGLKAILAPIRDQLEWFEVYTVARRAHHLQTERGLDQGFDNADLEATLGWVEQNRPEWIEAADELMAYQEALLDYVVDSGVITRETADAFRQGNPFYVPLYKVQEPGRRGTLGSDRSDHIFSPFKRIGSSGKDIVSPIESIIKNTFFYTKLAQKQKVSKSLAGISGMHGSGRWIRPIDTPMALKAKVGKKELTDWMRREVGKELGYEALGKEFVDQIAELLPEMYMVMRPGDYFGQENVISVLQKRKDPRTGKEKVERQWYEVDPDVYRALTYSPEASNIGIVRAVSFPAQVLRTGATTSPEFIARNPFRDQTVAFVQSEYGYTPGIDLARGIFHLVNKTDAYWAWKRGGGEFASLVDMDRRGVLETMRKMQEQPLANVVKHPWQALQALAATMENATRIGEFLNVVRAGGQKRGAMQRWIAELDPQERQRARERLARIDQDPNLTTLAGWHSREISTQYSTHGASSTIQVLRMLSTFWNARIQSYKRLFRSFREDPVGASIRSFVGITLPTLALYAINRDDEEYWEIPQWQRDWFWMVKVPNVAAQAIPKFAAQQGEEGFLGQLVRPFVNTGETVWLRFPIPWELGFLFKTIPERILEWVDANDPQGLQESLLQMFSSQIYGTLLPMPTAAAPIVENVANYSFFMQRDIDPTWEEAEGRFIVRPGTSEFARGLAEMNHRMGITKFPGAERVIGTPAKIENLMYGYTGGVGRMMIDIADETGKRIGMFERREARPATMADVPGIRGFVARDPLLGSSESEQRFRREWGKIREVRATIRLLEREENFDALDEYLEDPRVQELDRLYPEFNRASQRLASLWSMHSQIERDPDLTAEEKIQQMRELGQERRELAREVIGRRLPGEPR